MLKKVTRKKNLKMANFLKKWGILGKEWFSKVKIAIKENSFLWFSWFGNPFFLTLRVLKEKNTFVLEKKWKDRQFWEKKKCFNYILPRKSRYPQISKTISLDKKIVLNFFFVMNPINIFFMFLWEFDARYWIIHNRKIT